MNFASQPSSQPLHVELKRMVESLANCICATEEPEATLNSLVAQLHREVQVTHRLANRHLNRRQAASV